MKKRKVLHCVIYIMCSIYMFYGLDIYLNAENANSDLQLIEEDLKINDSINIPDPVFREVITTYLGIEIDDEILKSEIQKISNILAAGTAEKKIKSIEGIEFTDTSTTARGTIELTNNEISSIKEFENFKHKSSRSLFLAGNKIEDIGPLKNWRGGLYLHSQNIQKPEIKSIGKTAYVENTIKDLDGKPIIPINISHFGRYDAINNQIIVENLTEDIILEFDFYKPVAPASFNGRVSTPIKFVSNFPILNGIEDVSLMKGDDFDSMYEITANDVEDGDLTAHILVNGVVNVNIPGEYILVYEITDSDGNKTVKQRKITVLDLNPKEYIVKFDSNGGAVVESESVYFDSLVTEPTSPTKDGHTFAGWYKEEGLIYEWNYAFDKMPDRDITLYARWTVNKYDVSYDSNGGSIVESESVYFDSLVTEPTYPTKDGHTFAGWYKEEGLINEWNFAFDKMPDRDITLYARWTANKYDVSYDSNGGSIVESESVYSDSLVTKPTSPTKDGHTFAGWYKEEGLINEWNFANEKMPANNVKLYAKWTQNFYNIIFDGNTGNGTMNDIIVNQSDTILVPYATFTKVGYKATHWNTRADGTGKTYNFGDILDPMIALRLYQGDIVLYAQWEILPVEVLPPTTVEPPVVQIPKEESKKIYETGIFSNISMYVLSGCILIALFLIRKIIIRNVD